MSAPNDDETTRELERELLALRCRRGERAAWEELVATFERPLYYYLRRMVRGGDEAWVVLQDCWVRVFTNLATLEDPRKLAPWIYSVARTALRQRVSELARERTATVELDDTPDVNSGGELAHDLAHDAERVHAALSELIPPQREVLVLFFLEDLSLQAIAEVLEIPVGTVKSRLHHARRALSKVLSKLEARHGR
jgi:RNA polymerase sigma-70 factor (ECF subfamily)